MPFARVSIQDSPEQIAVRISELEASGAVNVNIAKVGDEYIITYDQKPRVGRPPKETRG